MTFGGYSKHLSPLMPQEIVVYLKYKIINSIESEREQYLE